MAHQIGKGDKFAEIRSEGKRAWHGLGVAIPEGLEAVEAFKRVGLGWETELCPAYYERLTKTGVDPRRLEGFFAHIRKDTGDMLGMVTSDYKPFENMDLARLADSLADADHTICVETCGSLYDGKRVYVLVKMPKVIMATKADPLETFICVSNGHGGHAVLSAYPTSVRVVCANTLRWSESSMIKGARWRHTGDFDSKVKQARLVLGLASEEMDRFEEQVAHLVRTNLSPKKRDEYMERVYEKCFGKIDPDGDADTVEKLLKKRAGILEAWTANLDD